MKPFAIAGVVVCAVAVVAAVALLFYRDGNLHSEERMIQKAHDAGFVERQVLIEGSAINYAEGPNNGPALMLIHGQGMEWEDYAKVLPDLAKDFHVFAVDCFGHGESAHDAGLYTCQALGNALIGFADSVIGEPFVVSGHSSGGILAAYVAAKDPSNVIACVLEDPPFFNVLPGEVQEGEGSFVWFDGYIPAHEYVEAQSTEPYAAFYAEHSYLFKLFGGLRDRTVEEIRTSCEAHPDEHVTTEWIPHDWTRGVYFMDDFDPEFGNAFYTGSWFDGVDQEQLLSEIRCPVLYLKAKTNYGDDGVLYAANTDEDAARVVEAIADCEMVVIDSGHNIHYEKPSEFVGAIRRILSMGSSRSSA